MPNDQPKHYLVWRDQRGVRQIKVYDDADVGHAAYCQAERAILIPSSKWADYEVCLFSTDSLATLVKTHASWVAPETLDGTFGGLLSRSEPEVLRDG